MDVDDVDDRWTRDPRTRRRRRRTRWPPASAARPPTRRPRPRGRARGPRGAVDVHFGRQKAKKTAVNTQRTTSKTSLASASSPSCCAPLWPQAKSAIARKSCGSSCREADNGPKADEGREAEKNLWKLVSHFAFILFTPFERLNILFSVLTLIFSFGQNTYKPL